jgi:hypothetical protein
MFKNTQEQSIKAVLLRLCSVEPGVLRAQFFYNEISKCDFDYMSCCM